MSINIKLIRLEMKKIILSTIAAIVIGGLFGWLISQTGWDLKIIFWLLGGSGLFMVFVFVLSIDPEGDYKEKTERILTYGGFVSSCYSGALLHASWFNSNYQIPLVIILGALIFGLSVFQLAVGLSR
jgi:hypothetical protein